LHKILLDILTFVNAAGILFRSLKVWIWKFSELQVKSKIRKLWKEIIHELNVPLVSILYNPSSSGPPKNLFCTPSFY